MDLRRSCLVIYDDKIALKLAASFCHELDLKVYIADTPREAVVELKRRRYELLVVDHHVHGISGCEILDHLRSHVRGANIVVFTSDTSEATRALYEERGAIEFLYKLLSKPAMHFKLKMLLDRVS